MKNDIESIAQRVLNIYPVKRAGLFGSAARGDMTTNSDIDMIVEFLPDTVNGHLKIRTFGHEKSSTILWKHHPSFT
jgi:predicted nucleotidyltransferase